MWHIMHVRTSPSSCTPTQTLHGDSYNDFVIERPLFTAKHYHYPANDSPFIAGIIFIGGCITLRYHQVVWKTIHWDMERGLRTIFFRRLSPVNTLQPSHCFPQEGFTGEKPRNLPLRKAMFIPLECVTPRKCVWTANVLSHCDCPTVLYHHQAMQSHIPPGTVYLTRTYNPHQLSHFSHSFYTPDFILFCSLDNKIYN